MAKLVLFTGSPGAGKTSVLNGIRKHKKYKIVNVGTLTESLGKKRHYIKDRDQIRYLEPHIIDELREGAFKQISKMKGEVIIDTHASISAKGRYTPGLPRESMRWLKGLCAIVYIDAEDEELLRRRISDKNRKRELEEPKEIETHRLINLAILAQCASDLNISLYIIHNKEGALNKTIERSMARLKEIFKE